MYIAKPFCRISHRFVFTVFAALGYGKSPPAGVDIFKSTDNGTTWKSTNWANGTGWCQGANLRWGGYRIMVHPNPQMKDVIYYASRSLGLWRSDQLASPGSWYKIDSFPNINWNTTNQGGIEYININPHNGNLYASVINYGIYQSTDNAKTWQKITNSEFNITQSLRSIFNPVIDDGLFFVADADKKKGFFVYDEKTKQWSNIEPMNEKKNDYAYHGLDISPDGKWFILAQHERPSNLFYHPYVSSTNQSDWNWIMLNGSNFDNRQNDIPWMTQTMFSDSPSCFIFNPVDYNKDPTKLSVLFASIVVWQNKDITNGSSEPWVSYNNGFEETCILDIATPSSGNVSLISGIADVEGFIHTDIYQYPLQRIYEANSSSQGALDTSGVDFCESNPQIIVRVPGNGANDAKTIANATISKDQGKTWTDLESHPPYVVTNNYTWNSIGGQIRIAPDNCNHMVWIPLFNVPWVTKDGGKTWINSTGAPNDVTGYLWDWNGANWHSFANDRVNGNYWYVYSRFAGNIFVSSDGGYNWTKTAHVGIQDGNKDLLKADFGQEGHVCIALGNPGLYCSTDHGKTFQRRTDVNITRLVGWGISKSDPKKSVMYYFGISQKDVDNGIITQAPYQINDNGQHIRMNINATYMLGDSTQLLKGDRQKYGRIYVASSGRGIYFSEYVDK